MTLRRLARADAAGVRRLAWAELIFAATPEFYRLIPGPVETALDLIADQIARPGTELEAVDALGEVGLVAALPSERVKDAKAAGAMEILRALDDDEGDAFLDAAAGFEAQVEPLPRGLRYVARLAVEPAARGSGAGREIMRLFKAAGDAPICLHVHADNSGAIGFYRRLGFAFQSDDPFAFRVMREG